VTQSLTHGAANGRARFPKEHETLERLGRESLDEIDATLARYGIDCDFRRTGQLTVATQPHQVADLAGGPGQFLDRQAVRAEVDSPTYLAGVWLRELTALAEDGNWWRSTPTRGPVASPSRAGRHWMRPWQPWNLARPTF